MVEATEPGQISDLDLQQHVLTQLNEADLIEDSSAIVSALKVTPVKLDAALKSLLVDEYVVLEVIERKTLELTGEGASYAQGGTPGFQYASALVLNEETLKADVEAQVGAQIAKLGFAAAMKNKWVKLAGEKKEKVVRTAEELKDTDQEQLKAYADAPSLDAHEKKTVDQFKKRKLVNVVTTKSYKVTKGAQYAPKRVKLET